MTNILALDTSSAQCSCALYTQGSCLSRSEYTPRTHTDLILPMADSLLAETQLSVKQLDAVAFGQGPGSFTGLRIASGVAQGIALGAEIPVIGISSLATLAQAVFVMQPQANQVFSAVDARMQEVYWGVFQKNAQGLAQLMGEEIVCKPEQISLPTEIQASLAVGSAWAEYPQLGEQCAAYLSQPPIAAYPQAEAMLPLAVAAFEAQHVVDVSQAQPVYLRNRVVG